MLLNYSFNSFNHLIILISIAVEPGEGQGEAGAGAAEGQRGEAQARTDGHCRHVKGRVHAAQYSKSTKTRSTTTSLTL